jgi:hypothetical protein
VTSRWAGEGNIEKLFFYGVPCGVGEINVVQEITMAVAVNNLKRNESFLSMGDRKVFILTFLLLLHQQRMLCCSP